MKYCYAFILLLIAFVPLEAQKGLSGLWKGTLTIGGINSSKEVKMELYLEVKGKKLKGRSYVHIAPGKTIEMDVKGKLFDDRSLYLHEIKFISTEDESFLPPFNRKYQLSYHRSFDSTLKGFWQEILTSPLDDHRERGRVNLAKVSESKA